MVTRWLLDVYCIDIFLELIGATGMSGPVGITGTTGATGDMIMHIISL
jgi:hypothetical protein